jgi:hypothetical protein
MSVQAMSAVFDHSSLTGIPRLVLLAIANRDGERGCFPSVDRIAHDAGCSVRATQDAIRRAVSVHELSVERNAGPGRTNVYHVLLTDGIQSTLDTRPRTPQELHPADSKTDLHPELKELGSSASTKPQNPKSTRKRDLIHDALAEVEGADPLELTRSHAKRIGVAASDIRSATPDVSPEDIRRRADVYRRLHPTWELTAFAIAAHWASLISPSNGRARAKTIEDIRAELEAESG